jgi:inhibitor of KinA sporulation pathway (predicted exonuclease)
MVTSLEYLKISLEGTHHSGIDDCRNISKILVRMFSDGYELEDANIKYVSK